MRYGLGMTNSTIKDFRATLASMQATPLLGQETNNLKRLSDFYKALENAKDALDAILEAWDEEIDDNEYWEASNEADTSLIAHVNRRL